MTTIAFNHTLCWMIFNGLWLIIAIASAYANHGTENKEARDAWALVAALSFNNFCENITTYFSL